MFKTILDRIAVDPNSDIEKSRFCLDDRCATETFPDPSELSTEDSVNRCVDPEKER
jgi:hypothetical protein